MEISLNKKGGVRGRGTHIGVCIKIRWEVVYEYHEVGEGVYIYVVDEGFII